MTRPNDLHLWNAAYAADLHERFLEDPSSVDPAWRERFEGAPVEAPERPSAIPSDQALHDAMGAVRLAHAIRGFGHLAARIDPLGSDPPGDPALDLVSYGLTEEDLARLPPSLILGPIAETAANALEAVSALREVYSRTTGFEYEHIRVPAERKWLRDAAEAGTFRPPRDPIDPVKLLERLTQVEVFEHFLQRTFPGKTRFSIEGLDMMVPIVDEVIGAAAEAGIRSLMVGMAHRGRLNVLAHNLGKPYAQILAEFKDPVRAASPAAGDDVGWMGDVKYHMGACRAFRDGREVSLMVCIAPNPSHLELVNPVIQGMARAAGTRADKPGPPRFDLSVTLPLCIHGDAAFPGEGVVAETLNLSRLPGYSTGGTLHLIANNQLGFTTTAIDARSTLYASDLAKGFKIPVIHVSADDPEACLEAARTAFAYRAKFQKDFVIDLVGYRRHGHNEGDEPRFTQPRLYALIEKHPTVRATWARTLVDRGVTSDEAAREMVSRRTAELQSCLESLKPEEDLVEPVVEPPPPGAARRVKTAVPEARLRPLLESLCTLPQGWSPHPRIERVLKARRSALDDADAQAVDWGAAEALALASVLEDGTPVRFTGQDAVRGTFSHRHFAIADQATGRMHVPLHALPQARASFEARDSALTECAAIGFEHGYNIEAPERLVIWEAQYGDFINVAQAVVDEFVASARAKWGQTASMVLLLPHGYEGHGPDHSSARVERFLQLSADCAMRIANPTTAAQYFHLLRRQAALLQVDPLPLVVLTPKSLLRHPRAASSLRDLAEGRWSPVLDDPDASRKPAAVRRLVLVSGKAYVDLVESPRRAAAPAVALARVEQLCPFPAEQVAAVIEGYTGLKEVVWLQEEPENMGAWDFARPRLEAILAGRCPLAFVGRQPSASPAEGSMARHAVNQSVIVEKAFALEAEPSRSKVSIQKS